MKKIIIATTLLLVVSVGQLKAAQRGLWVWNTTTLINSNTEMYRIINQSKADNITDIYIWSHSLLKNATWVAHMKTFIALAYCNNIRVWALDGDRSYLNDWSGPTSYYDFINDVLNYNNGAATNEKFYGIHTDIEPQDNQSEPRSSFHDNITDSNLNTSSGGVWQTTQALDREMLMRSWIDIAKQSFTTCHANNLKFGMAMPSWTDDYYGEPIQCTYNAAKKPVYQHMMQYLDDYCIMSYRTNTTVINICLGEITYADGISPRPHVWAGLETHCGVGAAVSYCDAAGKNTRAAFWVDVATIEATLGTHVSYTGMNIHDWQGGWQSLSPAATNVTDPGCTALPVTYLNINGALINGHASLQWTTSMEINTRAFEIQQSNTDGSYSTIATLAAAGNSDLPIAYNWTSIQPLSGTAYYRIKQTDIDNEYTYTPVITIQSSDLWTIYSSGDNVVVLNSYDSELSLHLSYYNLSGQLLYEESVRVQANATQSFSSHLTPGFYILHTQEYRSGKNAKQKIVIEKE